MNKCWFLFIAVAAIVLNLLDVMTLSDDLLYRFIWQADETSDPQPIHTLSDLLTSQINHYQYQNGRAIVHTIGQFMLCMVPQWLFQVVNGLLFVLLVYLCLKLSDQKLTSYVLVLTCLMLFVFIRGVRTTLLWSIGTVNYLWVTVATLLLLLHLRHLGWDRACWRDVLLSPLALLAGWGHEALSVPVSVAIVVFLVFNVKRIVRGPSLPAFLPFMLFYLFGTLLCLLSPGIWGRASEGITLWSRLLSGGLNMVFNVRVLWLLLILMFWLWLHDRYQFKSLISHERYLLIMLATALLIVFTCGTTLERVAFFTDFIALLLILRNFVPTPRIESIVKWGGTVVLLLFFVGALIVRTDNARRFSFIERQMQTPGQELIAVPTLLSPHEGGAGGGLVNPSAEFGFYCSYMGFDSSDINMRCAAKLYGKQRMLFLPQDVVERITADSTAYRHCQPDAGGNLYLWQMNRPHAVNHLIFELNDEDPSQLLPHQRLVAYHSDTYELDPFNYEVITLQGRPYLVFTKPTTNIFRRIKRVKIL